MLGALLWALSLAGDPTAISAGRLRPPSWASPLGTDHLGRDVLARLLHGASLTLGFAGAALAACLLIGTLAGAAAAAARPGLGAGLLRVVDVLVAVPTVVTALLITALLRPGTTTMLLAVLVSGWTPFARLTHDVCRRLLAAEFVEAAKAAGATRSRILLRHVLPNAARPLLAHACLRFANTMLLVAGLSFLGLGAQPPTPEWGAMLAQAQPYAERAPVLVAVPAAAIVSTAFGAVLLGRRMEARWFHSPALMRV